MKHHKSAQDSKKKHNDSSGSRKANKKGHKKGRKRNDGRMGNESSHGKAILYTVGAVAVAVGVSSVLMLVLANTSLSAMAQDGVMIGASVVAGGIAYAAGAPRLAVSLPAASCAVAVGRRIVAAGIDRRAQEMIDRMRQLGGGGSTTSTGTSSTTTTSSTTSTGGTQTGGQLPPPNPTTNPGGFVYDGQWTPHTRVYG